MQQQNLMGEQFMMLMNSQLFAETRWKFKMGNVRKRVQKLAFLDSAVMLTELSIVSVQSVVNCLDFLLWPESQSKARLFVPSDLSERPSFLYCR